MASMPPINNWVNVAAVRSELLVTRSESAQRSDGTSEDLSGGFYFRAARSSLVQGQVIQLIGNAGCSVRDACMAHLAPGDFVLSKIAHTQRMSKPKVPSGEWQPRGRAAES